MEEIIIVLICLFLNMMLSGAEMAFVTVSRAQLSSRRENRGARILLVLKKNPERILSVIQIGITLVGAIAAAVGGAGAEESLAPILAEKFQWTKGTSELISIVCVVLPLTYLNVVVGELVPKTVALRNPLKISLLAAVPLRFGELILSPVVNVLESSTNVFLKIFRVSTQQESSHQQDIEFENLDTKAKEYVVNVVRANKRAAREAMVPWEGAITINRTDSIEEVEKKILNSRHTRLPVMDEAEVVGLVNTKEIWASIRHGKTDWNELIRPVLRFKGFDPLFRIMQKMQQNRTHLAVIYEGVQLAGLVTLEDIFEEIIGDIYDEDDDGLLKKILASKSVKSYQR